MRHLVRMMSCRIYSQRFTVVLHPCGHHAPEVTHVADFPVGRCKSCRRQRKACATWHRARFQATFESRSRAPHLGLQHPARVGSLLPARAGGDQHDLEDDRDGDQRGRQQQRRERREPRAAAQRRELHDAPQQRSCGQRRRQLDQRVGARQVGPAGKAADLAARARAR